VRRGNLILFNKPFGVMSQFSGGHPNLSDYIDIKDFYPAGRLDKDSEGLLLLTNDGALQARIAEPKFKMEKTYWAQVEGEISAQALMLLARGVELKDGLTSPAKARRIECPLAKRNPDIRVRKSQPTSWIELTITEGRNRQVRRMTAATGYPTLRLFRHSIGSWEIGDLAVGEFRQVQVNLPQKPRTKQKPRSKPG
jgi:23S rRNA pseudouridine2457 synthase